MHIKPGITLRHRTTGALYKIDTVKLHDEANTHDTTVPADQLAEVFEENGTDVADCRQAWENTYHKVRPEIPYEQWEYVWKKATASGAEGLPPL